MSKLKAMQDLFFKAITRGETENEAIANIKASPAPSAEDRLEIYQMAYRSRLTKCVKADFPAVCKILGEDQLAELMERFFAHVYFSTPNINEFTGIWFKYFLEQQQPPALLALAQYEYAMMLSFYRHIQPNQGQLHAPMVISPAPLQQIILDNSVMLQESDWPLVHMQKQQMLLPKKKQFSIIWTDRNQIQCEELSQAEYLLVVLFKEKSTMDEVLDSLTFLPNTAETAAFLQQTIAKLVQKKILVGV